ncbi:MAG: HAD-IIIC family phosphatase [Candidatus Omnitrophica bacterium]|nr:HAD-IIIC family phosphatase [Candidatus Omnitrophota bacterium]
MRQLTEEEILKDIRQAQQKKDPAAILQSSLALAEHFPGHSNRLIAAKSINGAIPALEAEYSERQKARIALIFSSTAAWLKDYLTVDLCGEGILPQIYVAPYRQMEQEVLNLESDLYRFSPEIIFLHAELSSLLPQDSQYDDRAIRAVVDALASLVHSLRKKTKSLIIIDNFPQPAYLPVRSNRDLKANSVKEWFFQLNNAVSDCFQRDDSILISDFDHLTAVHGKERATDPKWLYLAHLEISESFLPSVSRKYAGYVKALKGKTRKCLVLDLDNTLWGGIIGEDGMEGIRLSQTGEGREFYEFQKFLQSLTHRGVLLAVNSKNNYEDAVKIIREHPSMLLKEAHFCCLKINWKDKSSNLLEIAQELNIGVDAIVFVDDDPRERALVRQSLPQVLVPEMPADPAEYCRVLSRLNDFETLNFTEEDLKRTELYRQQKQREQLRESSSSLGDYLWSLEISVEVFEAGGKELPRIAQLMQKTNQFNMTARRFSVAELKNLAETGWRLFAVQVKDRFGDNGISGSAVLEKQGRSCVIKSFLMSCRVLGRGVEDYLMNHLYQTAKSEGAERLVGELIFTEKNQPARGFYSQYGFTLLKQEGDKSEWVYPVEGNQPKPVAWINAGRHARK